MRPVLCLVCGMALPAEARSDRRYCAGRCRMRALRLRGLIGDSNRHRRTHGDRESGAQQLRAAEADLDAVCQLLEQERLARRECEAAFASYRATQAHIPGSTEQGQGPLQRTAQPAFDELRRKLALLTDEVKGLREKSARVDDLTKTNQALREEIASLKDQLTAHETQVAALEQSEAALRQQVGKLNQNLSEATEHIRIYRQQQVVSIVTTAMASLSTAATEYFSSTRGEDTTKRQAAGQKLTPEQQRERDWWEKVTELQRRGWNVAADYLVTLKESEIAWEDSLAKFQEVRRRPVTAQKIPAGTDPKALAMAAALAARQDYFENPPPKRARSVRWVHPDYQLDSDSESELRQQVHRTIAAIQRQRQ